MKKVRCKVVRRYEKEFFQGSFRKEKETWSSGRIIDLSVIKDKQSQLLIGNTLLQ